MAIRFDEIQLASAGNHLYPTLSNGGGNGLRIQSSTGYGDFGSGNTSYFHISTDRGSFYFSKSISSDGHLSAYGGDENLTNWNNVDASAFRSKANTAYLLDPDNTGTSLNVAGAIQLPDAKAIMWSGNNILSHNGTQTYIGDNSSSSTVTITGGNTTFTGAVTASNINTSIKYLGVGQDYDTDRTTKVTSGVALYGAYNGGSNSPHTYDFSAQFIGNARGFELSAAWHSQTRLKIRSLRDCCQNWSSFYDIAIHGLNNSASQLYATLYYDSANTAYYLDPASTSNLNDVEIVQLAVDDYIYHKGDTNTYFGFNGADQWKLHVGGGDRLMVTTSQFTSNLNVAAPLYYDKDNTSYYLNPSSTSIALKINGIIDQDFQSSNLNTAWTAPGSSYSQGFIVGRYQGGAANQPHHNDNANWFANIYSHSSSSGSTASYGLQLAGSNAGSGENSLSLRTVSNGSFSAWRRIYHEGHLPTLSELGALSSSDSQVVSSASGNRWGVNGFIATDGVMEVGKYIDFHNSDGDTSDYALRITSNGSTAAFSAGISSTTASFGTSATAPKFYDTSGTTYYLDLDNNGSIALKARGSILSYDSGGGNLYLRSEQSRTLYGSNAYENGVTVLTNQATTNYATFNTRGVTAAVLGNTPWGTGSASSGKDIFNIVRVNQAAYGPSSGKGSFRKVLNLRGNGNLYLGHASTTGAVYATSYYDKASTTRYVDPGSTGDSIRVSGDVVAYYSSDKRLKNNIKPIDNALDKVNSINGVTFEWNEKSHKETGKKDVGVVAQEVEKILPEVVETRTNGYKAVDYQKLTALLIESVKELTKEVQDLKSQINK